MAYSVEQQDWLPLDNAAKIYPSTTSEKSPAEFRLTFTLREPVRLLWLQRAVERVMPRFPYFQVTLRRGFFWYYLQRTPAVPGIELLQNVPVSVISIKERTAPLLRISARERTVAVDFSHIITDGRGGLRFLLTLAAEYLRQAGTAVAPHSEIMDPDEQPRADEFEDAHRKSFSTSSGQPEELSAAYHIGGRPFKHRRYKALSGTIPAAEGLRLAKSRGVSLTEYLAALYMYSLMQVFQSEEQRQRRRQKRKIIRLEVPVDMRRYHPTGTLRNFSLYVSPEMDMALGEYSFDEVVTHMHHSIRLLKNKKQLGRQIARNVGSELNPFIRFMPLVIKDMVLSSVYSRLGEALYSGVLSNLGRVAVPPELEEHLEGLNFDLNPNHVMKKACGVLSFKDQLTITFTRVIESTLLEQYFFNHLTDEGVPVKITEY